MKGRVLHYFAEGNTARGYANLYESNIQNLHRLLILKGGSKACKSRLLKKTGLHYENEGYSLQYIHCPMNHEHIAGLIINELHVGVIDGKGIQRLDAKIANKKKCYLNIEHLYALTDKQEPLSMLTSKVMRLKQEAYLWYEKALHIHDEWEAIFIDNMDFEKANALTEEMIVTLYGNTSSGKKGTVNRRFLGAATPIGAIDYVPALTEGLLKRYFIKGRPGSGKSTMLKKIAIEAEMRGYDVEIYHCGLDPHSLDMVIVRELGFAIFDSTAPHEYFPERDGDEIVDVYATCITPGTDEDYAGDIKHIKERYQEKMKKGTEALHLAKQAEDELETVYESIVDMTREAVVEEKIFNFIEEVGNAPKI